jgi:hypothetical protein
MSYQSYYDGYDRHTGENGSQNSGPPSYQESERMPVGQPRANRSYQSSHQQVGDDPLEHEPVFSSARLRNLQRGRDVSASLAPTTNPDQNSQVRSQRDSAFQSTAPSSQVDGPIGRESGYRAAFSNLKGRAMSRQAAMEKVASAGYETNDRQRSEEGRRNSYRGGSFSSQEAPPDHSHHTEEYELVLAGQRLANQEKAMEMLANLASETNQAESPIGYRRGRRGTHSSQYSGHGTGDSARNPLDSKGSSRRKCDWSHVFRNQATLRCISQSCLPADKEA